MKELSDFLQVSLNAKEKSALLKEVITEAEAVNRHELELADKMNAFRAREAKCEASMIANAANAAENMARSTELKALQEEAMRAGQENRKRQLELAASEAGVREERSVLSAASLKFQDESASLKEQLRAEIESAAEVRATYELKLEQMKKLMGE